MSTRGSLLYKSWPEEFKKYNKYGFRKELSIHIYHECRDNNIYLEINVLGKDIINVKLPLWILPRRYKECKLRYFREGTG